MMKSYVIPSIFFVLLILLVGSASATCPNAATSSCTTATCSTGTCATCTACNVDFTVTGKTLSSGLVQASFIGKVSCNCPSCVLQWQYGDGTHSAVLPETAANLKAVHNYKPGRYTVHLYVWNSAGKYCGGIGHVLNVK